MTVGDAATCAELERFPLPVPAMDIAVSPDGQHYAVAFVDGRVRVYGLGVGD